jgi:uncharacterized membrane protein
MDRMLVVVFENEDKAREGSRALRELDQEGFIAVYDAAVVTKSHNGKATARQRQERLTNSVPWGLLQEPRSAVSSACWLARLGRRWAP